MKQIDVIDEHRIKRMLPFLPCKYIRSNKHALYYETID